MRALTVGRRLAVSTWAFMRRTLAQRGVHERKTAGLPRPFSMLSDGGRSELVAEADLQAPARLRRAVLDAEGFVRHEVVDVATLGIHAGIVDDAAHVAAAVVVEQDL